MAKLKKSTKWLIVAIMMMVVGMGLMMYCYTQEKRFIPVYGPLYGSIGWGMMLIGMIMAAAIVATTNRPSRYH
ncbi:MAG TPA: hypothetical protein VL576_03185 [Candidatus Paceibacterota bacterium]|jgi:hypothetical protein|nr:hypothetical protein [Candidatus Paceibacterota bacterium]